MFSTWLTDQLRDREWSQADLVKRSGLSPATISRLITEQRQPGADACRAIAQAFKLPESEVLRAAGLMTPSPKVDPVMEEILDLLARLPEDDKDELLELARVKVARHDKKRGANKPARKNVTA